METEHRQGVQGFKGLGFTALGFKALGFVGFRV